MNFKIFIAISLSLIGLSCSIQPVLALPPAEDVPEEVLRTEIITEARSPIDGQALTAAEYAELQAQLQAQPLIEAQLDPKIKDQIFLLRIRKLLRTIVPLP